LFFRGEIRPLVWNRLDRLLLLWAVVTVTTGTLHAATLTAFLNRFGTAVDALSVYFFFRNRFRTPQDVGDVARQFLLCSFAVLGFMLYEHETSRNLFGIFGGRDVPEITDIRDGRLRCQGAFAHPILAGCFYAALLPLYAVLGCSSRRWRLVVAGSAAAVAITVLTASSTPMIALLTCAAGVVAYPFRSAMRYVRWLAAVGLVFLHFSMKQPVWHLLARIDIAGARPAGTASTSSTSGSSTSTSGGCSARCTPVSGEPACRTLPTSTSPKVSAAACLACACSC